MSELVAMAGIRIGGWRGLPLHLARLLASVTLAAFTGCATAYTLHIGERAESPKAIDRALIQGDQLALGYIAVITAPEFLERTRREVCRTQKWLCVEFPARGSSPASPITVVGGRCRARPPAANARELPVYGYEGSDERGGPIYRRIRGRSQQEELMSRRPNTSLTCDRDTDVLSDARDDWVVVRPQVERVVRLAARHADGYADVVIVTLPQRREYRTWWSYPVVPVLLPIAGAVDLVTAPVQIWVLWKIAAPAAGIPSIWPTRVTTPRARWDMRRSSGPGSRPRDPVSGPWQR